MTFTIAISTKVPTWLIHLEEWEFRTLLDNCNIEPADKTQDAQRQPIHFRCRIYSTVFVGVFPKHVATNSSEIPLQYFTWFAANHAELQLARNNTIDCVLWMINAWQWPRSAVRWDVSMADLKPHIWRCLQPPAAVQLYIAVGTTTLSW